MTRQIIKGLTNISAGGQTYSSSLELHAALSSVKMATAAQGMSVVNRVG